MSDAGGVHPDPALLELFQAEMDTHLPVLNAGLLTMEQAGSGRTDFASLMRAAHSIKGAARIVGIDAAVRVAHALEDCFVAAQEGRVVFDAASVDLLLQGVDKLQRSGTAVAEAELAPGLIDELCERLAALRDDGRARAQAPEAAPVGHGQAPGSVEYANEVQVCLPPQFDDQAAETLRIKLIALLGDGVRRVRLDFSQVERVSARGLALIGSLARALGQGLAGGVEVAEGARAPVAALLRVTGLQRAGEQRT